MVSGHHRCSQGVQSVNLRPLRAEEKLRCNLQGKFVSAPPGRARVNFLGHFFAWRGDLEGRSGSFSTGSLSLCFEGDD